MVKRLPLIFSGLFLLIAVALAGAVACGDEEFSFPPSDLERPPSVNLPEGVPDELSIIVETYQLLKSDFVDQDKVTPQVLSEAAVRAMLEILDDPHTSYLGPELFKAQQESFRGSFEGIGALVSVVEDRLTIISPIAGSPAERAGILAGDIILEVDGEKTEDMTLNEAVLKIRGLRGTTVRLLVQHLDTPEPVLVEIVRDVIKLTSVQTQELADQLLRIQITNFTEKTGVEMADALRQARRDGVRGIVLDLRNNPGGLLGTTVQVTSQFLDSGLVLFEIDGQGERKDWPVRGGGLAQDLPVVVLVNSGSASGSEVLAGALQDHGRAKLIGTATFGKGTVGLVRSLSNGGGLFVTNSRWFTPNGNQIDRVGLTPDIELKVTREDTELRRDSQLQKAIEILQEQLATVPVG